MTKCDLIVVHESGLVEIRLKKAPINQLNDSDDARGFHRLALEPGADTSAALGLLDAALASIGVLPVDSGSWARVEAQCAAAWTEEVVAAFKAQSQ